MKMLATLLSKVAKYSSACKSTNPNFILAKGLSGREETCIKTFIKYKNSLFSNPNYVANLSLALNNVDDLAKMLF